MLRLVVDPCLNAHKRHVRDPPPFPITLLGPPIGEHLPPITVLSREAGQISRKTDTHAQEEEERHRRQTGRHPPPKPQRS